MLLTLGGGEVYISKSKSSFITEDQKKWIFSNAIPEQLLIIKDIMINSVYGQRKMNQTLYFRIDGDEIDKAKEKERIVNKLLELAKTYKDSNMIWESYFITKMTYKFDTLNINSRKSLSDAYYSIKYTFQQNFPIHSGYEFKLLGHQNTVVVQALYKSKLSDLKKIFRNGIYNYNYESNQLDSIFLTNQLIDDAVYLKYHNQYVLLVKDPTKLLFFDTRGNIVKEINLKNSSLRRMYF